MRVAHAFIIEAGFQDMRPHRRQLLEGIFSPKVDVCCWQFRHSKKRSFAYT
jgi:hypothetical protein